MNAGSPDACSPKKPGWPPVARLGLADIAALRDLEQLCFSYHWSEAQFKLGLERGAFHFLGTKDQGRLTAYVAFSAVAGEMEILNLGAHPDYRRQGLATNLLCAVLHICRKMGIETGYLDVKPSNLPAIALYEKLGFTCYGRRKNYYPDTGESALLYRYDFPHPGADAAKPQSASKESD
ncbi:MAG: [ribosomal protein S18]-alanine N-acetyltransferase [Desulfovibrionales bacterium]|nr:[ribosomal protein S18]-alanine N-acetyltransferase [Desulfovibrionales bacterium]